MSAPITEAVTLPRWKLTNYCRKECNSPAIEDGGHFERNAGGPWMLTADVLPMIEDLQRELRLAISARDYANDMLDKARLSATAAESRIQELEPGAECWAALAACARIKVMGAAGLHSESPDFASPQAHIGLEFWTHHEAKGDAQDINGRDWFCRFMDKALAAFRAAGRKP
jgi:hypothetical protein